MDDFEQQLKNALRRKEQPAWFEAKVLAATRRQPRFAFLRWLVATAAVLLVAGGIWTDHRAGVQARAQLQLALRITVTQLGKIQQSVRASTEEE
jgi:hypothetical protein